MNTSGALPVDIFCFIHLDLHMYTDGFAFFIVGFDSYVIFINI